MHFAGPDMTHDEATWAGLEAFETPAGADLTINVYALSPALGVGNRDGGACPVPVTLTVSHGRLTLETDDGYRVQLPATQMSAQLDERDVGMACIELEHAGAATGRAKTYLFLLGGTTRCRLVRERESLRVAFGDLLGVVLREPPESNGP
jgi:hypothetical protein